MLNRRAIEQRVLLIRLEANGLIHSEVLLAITTLLLLLILGLFHLSELAHCLLLGKFDAILSIKHLVHVAGLQLLIAFPARLQL